MSKITLHHSLARAMRLFRLINKGYAFAFDVTANCWDNGREQGLALRVISLARGGKSGTVFIAEARASDQTIVVVDGEPNPFDNKPSDAAWNTGRKYFDMNDTKGVVKHVREALVMLGSREAMLQTRGTK
jgi:hypothetical protein